MPRAEIYLEDARSLGELTGANVRFVFPDGFNPESSAHQLANILRMKLDEMAKAGELTALSEREDHGDMSAANDAAGLQDRPAQLELVARDE